MKINRIKIDKAVIYPKAFYKKLEEEQARFKKKTIDAPEKKNDCVIEEIDCEKSLINLTYTEPKFKPRGKPVRKKIKATDKRPPGIVNENIDNKNMSTVKKSYKYTDNSPEAEKCVIEEVDCKLSLINIGYDDTEMESEEKTELEMKEKAELQMKEKAELQMKEKEELQMEEKAESEIEEKTESEMRTESEPEIEDGFTAQSWTGENENAESTMAEPQRTNEVANTDTSDNLPVYDITRYHNSVIIDTIMEYYDEDEKTGTALNGETEEMDKKDGNPDEDTVFKNVLAAENNEDNIINDSKGVQDGISESNPLDEENKENKNSIRKSGMLKLNIGNKKIILHFGAIHIENKFGFISLLALLGLLGIFTENRGCLGFWAFLYYTHYFFYVPDEFFKNRVQKAAAPAFFTGAVISILSVVLKALFNDILLLILGMGISLVISILVFTINLTFYLMEKDENTGPPQQSE